MESNQLENRGKVVVMQTSINYIHSVDPSILEDMFGEEGYDKCYVGDSPLAEKTYYVVK